MKSFSLIVAAVALVSQVVALTVNTPVNVVECQPIQFTWLDGTSPFFLSLIPGGQPSAPAIKQFPQQTGNSFTWLVDLQPNTIFTIALKDSTGTQAFSDIVTIQDGGNRTCENTAVNDSGSAGGSATGAPGATAPPASGASTTPSPTPSGSGTSKSAGSSSSSGSAAPAKTNAASRSSVGAFGVAGLMGLVGAALF